MYIIRTLIYNPEINYNKRWITNQMHNGHKPASPQISFHKPNVQLFQFGAVLELSYPKLQDKDTHQLEQRNFLEARKCNL